jgi:transporter family-2 protein
MSTYSRPVFALGVGGAVLVGILTATQSRINSELARSLGDGYLSAVISFGSGLVILSVIMAFWRPGHTGLRRAVASVRSGSTPWWYLMGGAGGGLFVLSQGLSGAILGVALFTIAVVCGQTVSGMIIDRRGIGATPPASITFTRLLGSLLALAAVALSLSSKFAVQTPPWVLLLPFVAGLLVGIQQATNGQVRIIAKSALTATFLNFAVGATILVAACIVHELLAWAPHTFPMNPLLYLGGLIGTIFIGTAVVVVRVTGVLLLGLGSVAGQLVASLIIDAVVPLSGETIAVTTVLGTLLTLVAVTIAAMPSKALPSRALRSR